MDEFEQFRQTFFAECGELLADMEERLSALSALPPDGAHGEQLNAIFRAAHSIKGGAGAFGFNAIMRFTHALEALLDGLRDGRFGLSQPLIALMLKAGDTITHMLETVKAGGEPAAATGADLLAEMQAVTGAAGGLPKPVPAATAGSEQTWLIRFAPQADFFEDGSDPLAVLGALARLGEARVALDDSDLPELAALDPLRSYLRWEIELVTAATEAAIHECFEFVADRAEISVAQAASPTAPAAAPSAATENPAGAVQGSIRVDLDKVDRLVNTVGELVIAQAMAGARLNGLPPQLAAVMQREMDELAQYTRELQEAVMSIRMQPVKSVFARMPRLVRDTAAQVGKEVRLVMQGETTEVDKTVIERLADPLTHMIRNSIDHGIETPDQRVWNDKDQQGTITLSAAQRSGQIIIEISDDGAGINRARVLAKAREKGLLAPDAMPDEAGIDNLIFLPGFSTAEAVTDLSGRGVGMDVVKRNIEAMGGTVCVFSTEGQGSRFSISLPLTLAILDGMVVRTGGEHYIIPTTSILETLRPAPGAIQPVNGHSDIISLRGEIIPVIYLARLFGIEDAESDPGRMLAVLVESGRQKMAIMIDELVGQQHVVIKSLELNTGAVEGISSATILGDGRVALILEINDLRHLCQTRRQEQAAIAA